MRITWLAINASHAHASLALPLLHAATDPCLSAEWAAVQVTVHDPPAAVLHRVLATRPDVLAASVWLANRAAVLAVVRRTKALLPGCRVILGGPEFLGGNAAFLDREPAVDAVLRGEGELAFADWLAVAHDRGQWQTIAGLCWRDDGGRSHDQGTACLTAEQWADLPPPTDSPFFAWDRPFVTLETARGCAGTCSFCTNCRTGPVRHLPADHLRRQLRECRRRGVREVRILDRTFNASPARAAESLDLFAAECPDARFHLEIHPALLPPALRARLAAARPGALHIEAGLQSGTTAALAAVGRPGTPEAAWDGVRFLCEAGLAPHVDLLAGLPEQTLADVLADVLRLIALGPDEVQLETLKLLPGTPLAAQAPGLGLVAAPDPPYEVLRTAHLPPADLETCRRLSRLIDRFHNHPALRRTVRDAVRRDPHLVQALLDLPPERLDLDGEMGLELRFQRLHELARERRDTVLAEDLEREWIRTGFSPAHGLAPAQPWRGPIPAAATRTWGGGDADDRSPGRHVWHLRQADGQTWFRFAPDSGRAATAVFRLPQ